MANKHIQFTEEARIEFHKIKCFMDFNGKADEFWEDLERQIKMISDFPEAFQVRYKNVRIVPLEKFNYSIHYVIKPNEILVYRFLNQKQNF
ncbi:type II toxin-antitoxin system RelE/ParE family toxin [Algibacter sp. 2305UL17-15]|uniref:type II toxin-antitoxin system RelE/ParE family toxin n=1 Tax=Algibacter sp. 2305UL17-15 TaxID=3231268 RepID=UPI003458FD07